MSYRTSFLTGSHVYGTLGPKSDVDLVVLVSPEEAELLLKEADDQGSMPPGSTSVKYGKLNLIMANDMESLAVWWEGTEELKKQKPVKRSDAVKLFKHLRKIHKII
jgi:hypothetical protein